MKTLNIAAVFTVAVLTSTSILAKGQGVDQTEKEFQQLMPITGTVETFFGDFELDNLIYGCP